MEKKIFTVREFNNEVKSLLESDFYLIGVLIKGEVTSLNKHYTGHYYFKLRGDDGSLLSVVMFSSYTKNAPSTLKNGDQVIVTGSINVYPVNGTYSFNARKIELDGLGSYLLELKELEEKLEKEGLFSKNKRPLKVLPKRIAILTAKTGAAIHDVTSTIQKRLKTEILIFPCLVQGELAPRSIIKALKKAYTYDIDLLILTRGGGSKDDLYAFNNEELVRTLALSPCPTITAVGHSIDSTLIDKVSDVSCITPTEAGIRAVEYKDELSERIDHLFSDIEFIINLSLNNYMYQVSSLKEKLSSSPVNKLNKMLDKTKLLNNELNNIMLNKISTYKYNYDILNSTLETLSPTNLLLKGYTFVYNKDKEIIKSIKNVKKDDNLSIVLNDGSLNVIVKDIMEKKDGQ